MANLDASWPLNIETKFVEMLVELMNQGRLVDGHMHPNQWFPIASQLSDMFGVTYTARKCSEKYKRLGMNHHEFSDLLTRETGFRWDPISNTVNKKASHFHRKGSPNFELLGVLFNGSTTRGVLKHSCAQDPPNIDEENELDDELRFGMLLSSARSASDSAPRGSGDADVVDRGNPHASPNGGVVINGSGHLAKRTVVEASSGSGSRSCRKGKEPTSSYMNDAIKEFTETTRLKKDLMMAKAIRGSQDASSAAIFDPMTKCTALLTKTTPELDDDHYFKAVELLRDKELQKAFISMPPKRSLSWILRL
ncbi:uncharacterized protein LOC132162944 [Corylus avellana]|uniref:uncharacterized protein LOC132162944 n=1 Tax=Corylus avellana TaxID=13451 RepID=UPI00286C0FC1|nr:uncharacterized protein LOC132162944 [Corylus avellana]